MARGEQYLRELRELRERGVRLVGECRPLPVGRKAASTSTATP